MTIHRLKLIADYPRWTVQAGHTTAMLFGAMHSKDARIVVVDNGHANSLASLALKYSGDKETARRCQRQCVTLAELTEGTSRAHGAPFLIDHEALSVVIDEALHEMRRMVNAAGQRAAEAERALADLRARYPD